MKKKLTFLFALVLLFSILPGCAEKAPAGTPTEAPIGTPTEAPMGTPTETPAETLPELILEDRSESTVWDAMPAFNFGQLETEKLERIPWYDGRMESVAGNTWAETKNGYYHVNGSFLYYADRTNLDKWVPVCNKPACGHSVSSLGCNAFIGGNAIWIREGRIWFLGPISLKQELHPDLLEVYGTALYSMAPDGTDARLEYRNEGLELSTAAGTSGEQVGSHYILSLTSSLDVDGLTTLKVLLLTKNGAKIVYQETGDNINIDSWESPFYGDAACYVYAMGEELFRLVGEELIPMDVAAYESNGGYLSGNFLRQLRPGDGYYDVNLETGEEVKLCDPRLESSVARIMLPNCIIEHNLNAKNMDDNAVRELEIFDGTAWRTVELPDELRYKQFSGEFYPIAVASDRILFWTVKFTGGGVRRTYYQVLLGRDTLTMELCGDKTSNH